MTARRVSAWAGVSNKTFYDLFSDREDCFLAAFDRSVEEIAAVVLPAWEAEREWSARVRAGLGALLVFLDGEPELRAAVFVEALGAGPRVLARRAEVLQRLAGVIDEGRAGATARELPSLTAEGLVGAAFGVIYARLLEERREPLVGPVNALMATIVLPYRGHAAAARELERRVPDPGNSLLAVSGGASITPTGGQAAPFGFRLTVRTQMVLTAVTQLTDGGGAPSNRQIATCAGIADQGQISKLLARLEAHGLLANTGGSTQGVPRAWRLTPRGEEILRATQPNNPETHNRMTTTIKENK